MPDSSVRITKVGKLLIVSMPADPDDAAVSSLQKDVLEAMQRLEPTGVVLDISAVEALDSFFARTVAETGQMVALMGGRTAIAGMRPHVAMTATQMGVTLGHTLAALDVEDALNLLDREAPRRRL